MENKCAMNILLAYCVELAREVSITEARRSFLASGRRFENKYKFFCNDIACRNKGVQIAGVNYRTTFHSIKEMQAHFKKMPNFDHDPSCKWILEPTLNSSQFGIDGTEHNNERVPKRLTNEFIAVFETNPVQQTATSYSCSDIEASNEIKIWSHQRKVSTDPANAGNISQNHTQDFRRFVDSYLEARETLSRDEYFNLSFRLARNAEKIKYAEYFRPIKDGNDRGVIFGGARLITKMDGLNLLFYDKIDGMDVHLIIHEQIINQFRFRRSINEVITSLANGSWPYTRVFAIGSLTSNHNDNPRKISLNISNLLHLVMLAPATK
jgi:hypothetical protein